MHDRDQTGPSAEGPAGGPLPAEPAGGDPRVPAGCRVDLAFEGGGAKGIAFIGALKAIEAHGLSPRRMVGTSAGAITALMVAVGFTADELFEAYLEELPDGQQRMQTFLDPPAFGLAHLPRESWIYRALTVRPGSGLRALAAWLWNPVGHAILALALRWSLVRSGVSLLTWGGAYSGEVFRGWLEGQLERKLSGAGQATLSQLHARTGVDLTLITADTTAHRMLVLNHRTAPDLPAVEAARMSMSLPVLWREAAWIKAWGTYRGESMVGHQLMDGGVVSNFPIELLAEPVGELFEMMGDPGEQVPILGLLIDENLDVPGAPPGEPRGWLSREVARLGLSRRLSALGSTMTAARDKVALAVWDRVTCRLPARGYGVAEFDLSRARARALVDAAQARVHAHLTSSRAPGEAAGGRGRDVAALTQPGTPGGTGDPS